MRVDDRIAAQTLGKASRQAVRPQGGGAFSISDDPAQISGQTRTNGTAAASDVSALFELQMAATSPKETRKRTVRRGTKLLDGLDRLKAAFLIGGERPEDWDQLAAEYRQPRDPNLPPEVAELLDHVDVRVAVELAKRGL